MIARSLTITLAEFIDIRSGRRRWLTRSPSRPTWKLGEYLHLLERNQLTGDLTGQMAFVRVIHVGGDSFQETFGFEVQWSSCESVTPEPLVVLDLDGVANSLRSKRHKDARKHWDPDNVAVLNEIIERANASILVSSSNRIGNIDWLRGLLIAGGVKGHLVGETPELVSASPGGILLARCRGDEIAAWLAAQPTPITRFVILDDSEGMGALESHLVRTTYDLGLRPEHVAPSLALLGVPT